MNQIEHTFHNHCPIFYPALHNSSFKIPGGINKTDNKSDENFLIVQASTDKRYSEFIEINSDMKKNILSLPRLILI